MVLGIVASKVLTEAVPFSTQNSLAPPMKGIVFNLLEEVVRREHGEDTWDSLLDAAGLDGAYTSLGSYGDDELIKIVAAASIALKTPADEIIRWFGRNALPLMAGKYPGFFKAHRNARSFVLTLNSIIHPEVRKIYPGADVPVFDFDVSSEDHLLMGYHSQRKLCAFAHGLVEGAAMFYSEEVLFEHLQCMNRGDAKCLFKIAFQPLAS